jgi:hypothetical protein
MPLITLLRQNRINAAMHYRGRLGALLLVLGIVAGCSQNDSLATVEGIVRLDGRPLTTGTVRFVPAAGRAATGQIQSDGTFQLGTYADSDGAVIGIHKVAIIAYEAAGGVKPAYEAGAQANKPLVPQRYMAVGTSGLTFEVKPVENRAEFDLQSQ